MLQTQRAGGGTTADTALPASALENLTIDAPEHTWRAWWPGCFHNLTTILPLWIIHKFNQNKDPIYSIDTYSSMTTTWSGLKLSALRTIRHITAPQWCCNPQLVSVFCILGHVTPDTKVATLLPAADNAVITSSGSYLLMGGGSVYLADGSLGGHTHHTTLWRHCTVEKWYDPIFFVFGL